MDIKKILVIDDEEKFCKIVKMALEAKGQYSVSTSTRGKEGIALAKAKKPDLILLDIMMPGMPGAQVAEELLEDSSLHSVPIIFVTAVISKEEVERNGGFIGGRNFIAKPVTREELCRRIDSLLRLREAEQNGCAH